MGEEHSENLTSIVSQAQGMSSQAPMTDSSNQEVERRRKEAPENFKTTRHRGLGKGRWRELAKMISNQQRAQSAAVLSNQPLSSEIQNYQEEQQKQKEEFVSSMIQNYQVKYQEQQKRQKEKFDKIFSHRDVLALLLHAFQCENTECLDPDCFKVKEMYRQSLQCYYNIYCTGASVGGGCDLCEKMWYFLRLHAESCKKEFCYVPHCSYLKHSMKMVPSLHSLQTYPQLPQVSLPLRSSPYWSQVSQPLQPFPYGSQILQPLQTFPQQAVVKGSTRKRDAEVVSDKMNRFDQNPLKAQKICMGSSGSSSLTTSTSLTETVNGSHQFKITGYSLLKGLGVGKCVASDTFDVGGYKWAIYFYPDGKNPEDNAAYVSVFIALASKGTDVRALFELTLLDQTGKERHKVHTHFERFLENGPCMLKYRGSMWGYKRFFKRTTLDTSDYLRDDCLSFYCKVGVVKSRTEGPKISSVPVPASDVGQKAQNSGEHLQSLPEQSDTHGGEDATEQATKGAMDKSSQISLAEAEVDTVDEKNVVVDKMGHLSIEEVALDTVDERHRSVDDEWTFV